MATKAAPSWPPKACASSWSTYYEPTPSATDKKVCFVCLAVLKTSRSCVRCGLPLCSKVCASTKDHMDRCSTTELPFALTVWCQKPDCLKRVKECCKKCGIFLYCDDKSHQTASPLHAMQCKIAAKLNPNMKNSKLPEPLHTQIIKFMEKCREVGGPYQDVTVPDVIRKCMDMMGEIDDGPIDPTDLKKLFPFLPNSECEKVAPGLSCFFTIQAKAFQIILGALMDIFPDTQIGSVGSGTGGLERLAQLVRSFKNIDKGHLTPENRRAFEEKNKEDVLCDPDPSEMNRRTVLPPTHNYLSDAIRSEVFRADAFTMLIVGANKNPQGEKPSYDVEAFQYALNHSHAIVVQTEEKTVGSNLLEIMLEKRAFSPDWRIQVSVKTVIRTGSELRTFRLYLLVNTKQTKTTLPDPLEIVESACRTTSPISALEKYSEQVIETTHNRNPSPEEIEGCNAATNLTLKIIELTKLFSQMVYFRDPCIRA